MWANGLVGAAIGTGATFYMYQRFQGQSVISNGRVTINQDVPTMRQRFDRFADDKGNMNLQGFVQSFLPTGKEKAAAPPAAAIPNSLKSVYKTLDANADGVLSYEEYCTLFSFISIKEQIWEAAFGMFDLDGNAKLDINEFKVAMEALKCDPSAKLQLSDSIVHSFFGKDQRKKLSMVEFRTLLSSLRYALREAEFDTMDGEGKGSITISAARKLLYRHSPSRAFANQEGNTGASLSKDVYIRFCDALRSSAEIQRALELYLPSKWGDDDEKRAGATCEEFWRALQCSHESSRFSRKEVEVLFDIIDADGSGEVHLEEFQNLAQALPTFNASHVVNYGEPKRNTIQQFAFCLQQR